MVAGALQRRGLARAALFGLATGFVVLAALAWASGMAVQKAADRMHSAAEISSTWDRVLMLVVNEHEAMNDYLRAPDLAGIDPVASAVGSAGSELAWLARHGVPQSTTQITLIADTYDVFTNSLKSLVAASRAKSRTDVAVLADEASLSAAALRKQLTVEIQLQHLRLNAMLAETKQTQHRLRSLVAFVTGVDVALVAVCASMLISYQRRIRVHAERSHHRSQHDPLTGLPNRTVLQERLTNLVSTAGDGRPEPFAVFMLDLDGFKEVNDTLGHDCGDQLLVAVAGRLVDMMRAGDTVVRLGGDEFAILVPSSGRDDAIDLGRRIQAAITEPVVLNDRTVRVGVSIGVALCPEHSVDARELLQQADAAMYTAKRNRLGVAMGGDEPAPAIGLSVGTT